MATILTINAVDRTLSVVSTSIRKRDNLNERVDSLSFEVTTHENKTFVPTINQAVVLTENGTKEFSGVIVSVSQSTERKIVRYKISCKDNSQHLDRKVVTERFENKTLWFIVDYLITTYADAESFTVNNVGGAGLTINSIAFNRIPLSECFKKLSKLTNFSWYVDYDKDIHFFSKNTEPAPFSLTDTSGNYQYDSLTISEDLSQIRNSITVEGGTKIGDERVVYEDGDGVKDTFDTKLKFSNQPVVEVGGVEQTVGIDGLNDDADFDCMWNYNEKYIRFTSGNIPAAGTRNIEMTGTPLIPILVRVPSAVSISQYGLYEAVIKDKSIISNEQAIARAKAELSAYAATINNGSFKTYTSGLRSGQILTINSTQRSKTLTVLIQSVSMAYRDHEGLKPEYSVTFASLRSLGIIDYLLRQLDDDELSEGESETLLNYLQATEELAITDTIGVPETLIAPYVYANDAGTTPNAARYNYSTYGRYDILVEGDDEVVVADAMTVTLQQSPYVFSNDAGTTTDAAKYGYSTYAAG